MENYEYYKMDARPTDVAPDLAFLSALLERYYQDNKEKVDQHDERVLDRLQVYLADLGRGRERKAKIDDLVDRSIKDHDFQVLLAAVLDAVERVYGATGEQWERLQREITRIRQREQWLVGRPQETEADGS